MYVSDYRYMCHRKKDCDWCMGPVICSAGKNPGNSHRKCSKKIKTYHTQCCYYRIKYWQYISLPMGFYAYYNVTLCFIFQDMYDLILDYGCHCTSHCEKPLTNVVNKLGFTPLTLAVKLARREVNSLLVRMI